MKKTIIFLTILLISSLIMTSCKSNTQPDINELLKELDKYSYTFNIEDFTVEKSNNIVYHTMTDGKTLLTIYCNQENEIIQCTLTSIETIDEKNTELFIKIGAIITSCDEKYLKSILINTVPYEKNTFEGWNLTIIKNELGTTFLLNNSSNTINNNQKPTLK